MYAVANFESTWTFEGSLGPSFLPAGILEFTNKVEIARYQAPAGKLNNQVSPTKVCNTSVYIPSLALGDGEGHKVHLYARIVSAYDTHLAHKER